MNHAEPLDLSGDNQTRECMHVSLAITNEAVSRKWRNLHFGLRNLMPLSEKKIMMEKLENFSHRFPDERGWLHKTLP